MPLHPAIAISQVSPPSSGTAAYGHLRAGLLDALAWNAPTTLPAALAMELGSWLDGLRGLLTGPAQGVAVAALPADHREVYTWAGLPLAAEGPLQWSVDLREEANLRLPCLTGGRLLLPPPQRLSELTAVELKPVRRFIAERLGVRLQAAPGMRLFVWPGIAVVVNCAGTCLGGFLHGPEHGQRSSLLLKPGEALTIR